MERGFAKNRNMVMLIKSPAHYCNMPVLSLPYHRRRFLAQAASAEIGLLTLPSRRSSAAPPQTGPGGHGTGVDWPCFLGPNGDGKSPETGILTQWGDHGPPVVWHRKLGTGYGMGAVCGGRFYHFDRHEDQARLTCLDSRSGAFLWVFTHHTDYEDMLGYNHGPRSSPVVDDGRVYLLGPEGMLHCVRAEDGKLVWKVDTARKFSVVQNFFGVGSTPVVEGDLLIVMVGGSTAESQTAGRFNQDRVIGNGAGVVAFDKRTGAVKYAINDELASYTTPRLATIAGRRWCFVFARGGLIAFEPRSAKWISIIPGEPSFTTASTPVRRSSSATKCSSRRPMDREVPCCVSGPAVMTSSGAIRPTATRQCGPTGTRRSIIEATSMGAAAAI